MNDAHRVRSGQRVGRLHQDRDGLLGVEGRVADETIGQRFAVDQLHDEERDALSVMDVFGVVVHVGDARVRQSCSVSRLGAKTGEEQRGVHEVVAEHLHRHLPLEHAIHSRPDLTHAADGDALGEQETIDEDHSCGDGCVHDIPSEFPGRVSWQSFLAEFPGRVSCRVSWQSFLAEFPGRVSWQSFLAEFVAFAS